jgi:NAD(P)-dependent dehydrogenase (short-subunit alcohol dehydrogenase family)
MSGRLTGKVAFITGAARGQGRAHAVRMASEGADIIAVDVAGKLPPCVPYDPATPEDLTETVELVEATGHKILASVVDIRDVDGLQKAVDDGVAALAASPDDHAVSPNLGGPTRGHRRRGVLAGQRRIEKCYGCGDFDRPGYDAVLSLSAPRRRSA